MRLKKLLRNAAVFLLGSALAMGMEMAGAAQEAVTEAAPEIAAEALTEGEEGQTEPDEEVASLHGIRFAKDYRDVYEILKKADNYYYYPMGGGLIDYAVEETADAAAPMAADSMSSAKSAVTYGAAQTEYSSTNLRELGVDEADVVKTDGSYIYILKGGQEILIVKADGADLELVSTVNISFGNSGSMMRSDMYVDGDSLYAACGISVYNSERSDKLTSSGWYYNGWENRTILYSFDITDRSQPVQTGRVEQDGDYLESRKIGDILYLYSSFRPYLDTESFENSSLAPYVGGGELEASDVAIPQVVTDAGYLIVSSVDLSKPSEVKDAKALISGYGQYYVSTDNLYAMNGHYEVNTDRTEIVKFRLDEGNIEGVGACDVKGYVNNSFSVDEYEGKLRVLATYTGSEWGTALSALGDLFGIDYYDPDTWVRHNALYILDEDMHMISRLKGIARDEEIRSARFFGDTAYFVTFRNTDPLFTADLSDPEKPQLKGELKVTGFSSYLHPYGDGRLLGIGYEADEETGNVTGVKLSMFDISDPQQVKETDRFVIRNITWCPAIENYKCILADPQKNLIGFYCSDRYMVFRYDEEKGFERMLLYDFYEDMINDTSSYDTMRGLYIGNEFYLAGAGYVIGFDMAQDFAKNAVLTQLGDL